MAPTLLSGSVPDQLLRHYSALKQELGASPYWSLRHLVCQIDRDRITVQGTVSSFYLKQLAQSLATRVAGIECFRSEITVEDNAVEDDARESAP